MDTQIDLSCGRSLYDDFPFCEQAFEHDIERMLKPLWGMRVRASLFSIKIAFFPPEQTLTLIQHGFGHVGAAGRLPSGAAGLLYVGPRPQEGPDGDRALERWISDALGWTLFYHKANSIAADIDIIAVHCWLDQIVSAGDLVDELTWSAASHLSHAPQ